MPIKTIFFCILFCSFSGFTGAQDFKKIYFHKSCPIDSVYLQSIEDKISNIKYFQFKEEFLDTGLFWNKDFSPDHCQIWLKPKRIRTDTFYFSTHSIAVARDIDLGFGFRKHKSRLDNRYSCVQIDTAFPSLSFSPSIYKTQTLDFNYNPYKLHPIYFQDTIKTNLFDTVYYNQANYNVLLELKGKKEWLELAKWRIYANHNYKPLTFNIHWLNNHDNDTSLPDYMIYFREQNINTWRETIAKFDLNEKEESWLHIEFMTSKYLGTHVIILVHFIPDKT